MKLVTETSVGLGGAISHPQISQNIPHIIILLNHGFSEFKQEVKIKTAMMLHDCKSNILKAEGGGSVFQNQSEVHSERLSQKVRVRF